ncbi:SAM-dependent methyltransferase [Paenibacillus illinoisensis]|uniref:SAM-dependent methyltransferase n=1 Tax=Paenibacillus illinoisensis TaxID=59845 RepID=A0ABW8HQI0_9BACL
MSREEQQENKSLGLELEKIIFIGRTYEEYRLMFNLAPEDLRGRSILDCPGGACSFSSHARRHGADSMAADIAYEHEIDNLELKGQQDVEHTIEQLEQVRDRYRWDYFGSMDGLKQARMSALRDCTADMRSFPLQYVYAELPVLPFTDEQFDMTLSAHFLFTYADRLDFSFHERTILELLRVTRQELRIFPTVDLSGKRYEHMDEIKSFLKNLGFRVTEVSTTYEFQQGAHTMLKITKPES